MPSKEEIKLLRELPPVDEILEEKEILSLLEMHPRNIVVSVIRQTLEVIRKGILQGKIKTIYKNKLIQDVMEQVIDHSRWNLRHVINGTGVVLHTNLGRALLSDRGKKAVAEISRGYCNLEMNLKTGKRGSRYSAVESLLCQLTGAEAALVVNNNAAAVLLALSTLSKGKEVIVSRGQLVEIGGSFRIPEVMAQSGGKLIEVGATNKTYSRDYENAVNEETALLLHVHMSNYRIVGFTAETSVEQLVLLGRKYQLPVMSDLGSGFLVDLSEYGLPKEPTVQETVKAGADVVTFSGDKLLGGPQAGILVGKKEFIEKMKINPLNRALRIDKFTVAALEATLRDYLDFNNCLQTIPTLRMITEPLSSLRRRGDELATILQAVLQFKAQVTVKEGYSQVGGGAMPTAMLPSIILTVKPAKISVENLVNRLRASSPPVVGRVQNETLVLDMRTLQENDTEPLLLSMRKAMQ